MAKTLQYRKVGAQTWLIATFDFVSPYTITELDPVEYEIRLYDDDTGLYSEIINEIASGGYVDVTVPSSLVVSTAETGIEIHDNSLFPKSGGSPIPYSIEVWIKPLTIDGSSYFFHSGDTDSGIRISLFYNITGGVYFEVFSSAGNRKSIRTANLNYLEVEKWWHIIATDDGGTSSDGLNLIINTEEPSISSNNSGTFASLPDLTGDYVVRLPVTIGTNIFKGKINLARFYHNKILSLAEATDLYNERQGKPLDGLPYEDDCKLEHRFNNNVFSHIGQNGTPIGVLTYDNDLPWNVPVNEVNFYSYTSFNSVMWTKMYKSSEWPEVTTTKPYFVIYSSDHATDGGGIAWAECDDVYFNGFVERGIILSGNQAETPWLIRIPTAVSGLSTDTIFLYYHTVMGEPGNDGKQQTRLRTTTGGLLHTATWTDQGRPLGIYNDDNHTGYCRVFQRDNGTFVANHLTYNQLNPKTYISESSDGLTFTRLLETTGDTVEGYSYGNNHINPFKRNGTQYAFIRIRIDGGDKLAIVTLDSNFLPVDIVEVLPDFYTMNILMLYVESDTAYVNFRFSQSGLRDRKTYMVEYDLTQLDA